MKNPLLSRGYRIFSYRLMKRIGLLENEILKENLEPVKETLHRARIFTTTEEYLATTLFTAIITTPITFLFLYFILIRGLLGTVIGEILLSMTFAFIYFAVLLFAFTIYPSYKLSRLRESIERHLPYATAHMATIAGTGVPVFQVFKIIGDFEEYKQVAKECRRISRNIDVFGYDTLTALSEAAKKTPSPAFKELLWDLVSISRTGGDIRSYLMEKADELLDKQETKQKEYIDSLEVLAEVYTTLFVAGPVLAVIMLTVMGTMGGLPFPLRSVFSFLIYVMLPILSVGFMIMLEGAKPAGGV